MKMTKEKIALVKDDPWLEANEQDILDRYERFKNKLAGIEADFGSLHAFADGHHYFGFNYDKKKKGWWYREWAPGAHQLALVGEFNDWNGDSHPLTKNDFGTWEIFLPDGEPQPKHEELVKVRVVSDMGTQDRIPAYIDRTWQNPETHDFSGQFWNPGKTFKWTDKSFEYPVNEPPLIYESHTGMATEEEKVGSFREFADNVLPRIKKLGYNCIQMMAVQEHPYYGSFGYHVSNFFAPSSRFGTPEDLKYLINKAHNLDIAVIMDIVHSHAVKNTAEGLNQFDGTEHQYFHEGSRGEHPGWDSKLFNYGKTEVLRFLLSNVKYWLEEFHFDGFRFDGVTSMLYFHHGDVAFDHYDKYFKDGTEWDAITYTQLANELIHEIKPGAISIAEDMSGMPGLCRKNEEGALGFDYRLGMGIPDYWIKILKHLRDEDWNIEEIWRTLTNRRWKEKTIAYAESHDQALVGDKTIAFWLMDKEMYFDMAKSHDNLIIDRGIAMHKIIRLITLMLGGEGYLNFMGNEFGHPEWIDFPREGNGWSYKHARRQWNLADHTELKYEYLFKFDAKMIHMARESKVLGTDQAQQLNMDETNKCIIGERGNLIFAINLHAENSIPDYQFPVPFEGEYAIILNSDEPELGGFDRVDSSVTHQTIKDENGRNMLSIYLPNRTAIVLKKIN
jgi:1,4-alpha-glucan branching enzyme